MCETVFVLRCSVQLVLICLVGAHLPASKCSWSMMLSISTADWPIELSEWKARRILCHGSMHLLKVGFAVWCAATILYDIAAAQSHGYISIIGGVRQSTHVCKILYTCPYTQLCTESCVCNVELSMDDRVALILWWSWTAACCDRANC